MASRRTALSISLLGAFTLLGAGAASAMPPLQCQDFANFAMRAQDEYYALGCPRSPLMHANRDGHFAWCLARNEFQVRADRDAKAAALRNCKANARPPRGGAGFGGPGPGFGGPGPGFGGPGFRGPAPCSQISGFYNGGSGSILAMKGDRIRVTVGKARPVAYGTCRGDRLVVDFTDDHVISGVFDGRVIRWDNRTSWTKN